MKKIIFLFFCVSTALTIFAQDGHGEVNDQQKAFMEFMTPGWAQEMMAEKVGEWKTTTKYWMTPGTEPQISEGKAIGEMILGGRYLQTIHEGTALGQPFKGISLESYDNARMVFISTWIDNLGTSITLSEGTYDKETKTLMYEGKMTDPMSGNQLNFRQVMKEIDKDHSQLEFFIEMDGKEFKNMEIEFIR